MTHRAGIQLSDLVAAIAVVEGVVSPGSIQNVPAPLGPVSVLILHGDQDSTVLYCGGRRPRRSNRSTTERREPVLTTDTTAPLRCARHHLCGGKECFRVCPGTEVKFYKLVGGEHDWHIPMNAPGNSPFNPN